MLFLSNCALGAMPKQYKKNNNNNNTSNLAAAVGIVMPTLCACSLTKNVVSRQKVFLRN